ncbi:ABC transporter substrate-binding protein [Yinghuangia soli]|uniref:ABC transporter substrate-binding protein n=1 Tax=Yinghuangia soli TaxID=2908204 RepID=A0AA41U5E0_9ACTN|nr:ABC transporter substrate-binding protein [Yinghuangia soli]MCF2533865.1 ABC transporter substrate-binding protein [Yinghuangia soli]
MHTRVAVALAASVLVAVTGCSSKSAGPKAENVDAAGFKSGPGVTDKSISLGVLTDLSGPAAALGKSAVQAQQLYLDQVNAQGGVCGRQIKLEVRDHAYDVQKAVAAYAEIQPNVAAFAQILGSAQTSALVDSIERDKVMTLIGGNPAAMLGHRHLQLINPTYDIEMINGVDFLVTKAGLKPGDKIGVVFQDGDYGSNAAEGVRFAAKKAGLEPVEQTIKATDTDMTAQVSALRAAGVKAITFSGTPAQTASLVGVAAATGLTVPVLGSSPSFVPQLMATPAKAALTKMFYLSSGVPALGGDEPAVRKLVADYQQKYPNEQLNQAVEVGAVNGAVMVETLKLACAAKDFTREGITDALRSLTKFTSGLGEVQDFSDPARVPSRKTYVLQPAEGVPGSLKTVQPATEAPGVADYLAAKH